MRVWRTISLLYFGTYTIVILQFLQGIVLTGPVIKRSMRMVREVYPEIETDIREGNQAEVCIIGDVVYGADEPVPSDQPCLKCKCQPPGVQCELIQCSQKQGCKAIHKSNQCCPEYQCECVHNGTVYGNGERLATLPGGECSVCYCRGGEVQCINVSCYKRSDCEGRTVPGQCCPKYDHCPLKEPLVDRSSSHIVPTSVVTEKGSFATAVYDVQELIKEDNKITETHPAITQSSVATQESIDVIDSYNNISISIPQLIEEKLEHDYTKAIPNITIQEIIPEIKEIPITTSPKLNINALVTKAHAIVAESHSNNSNKQTDDPLIDTDSESSEISEIYHQPPPVLKIGNQLLIFKKGELVSEKDISTPVPVITIIGAEGLQRGTEDSSEFHEISSQLQGPQREIGNLDDFFENEPPSANQEIPQRETHIISFVKQTKVSGTSTPELSTDLPPTSLEFEEVLVEQTNSNVTTNDSGLNPIIAPGNIEITSATSFIQINTTSSINEMSDMQSVSTGDIEAPNKSMITEADEKEIGTSVTYKQIEQKSVTKLLQNNSSINISSVPEVLNDMDPNKILEVTLNEPLADSNSTYEFNSVPFAEIPFQTAEHLPSETENFHNTTNSTKYYSATILINTDATLPPALLKQAAISDIEDEITVEIENKQYNETHVLVLNKDVTSTESFNHTWEEKLQDSGESTTIPNNQTSDTLSSENASIETSQENALQLNATDVVEILPGFQITTENSKSKEGNIKSEAEIINTQELLTTVKVIDDKILDSTSNVDILRQLNKELNNTLGSLNITSLNNSSGDAEAIFKELFEEVTASPSAYTNDQESSILQLHEKEFQLLQKVNEAISKFQSKESKEVLASRIMDILKDFFDTQHKYDINKPSTAPVLPVTAV